MSLERNKELARAAIAIWSTCDFSQVLEFFTADYVMHQHHDPDGSRRSRPQGDARLHP